MLRTRVIPCLLLKGGGLVKTRKFDRPAYVGDPINAVRIFNDKEVDELVFLDIDACHNNLGPNYELIQDIASEAFMPFAYGGGIRNVEQALRLLALGVEKVILNTHAAQSPDLIAGIARAAGSQSVVVAIDVKRDFFGRQHVYTKGGTQRVSSDPVEYARRMEQAGAGELMLTAVDREGTRTGYDLPLIESVSRAVSIPLIANGGAGTLTHLRQAWHAGASAVAAGSMFVFHGKHDAVLITYPRYSELEELFTDEATS